MGAHSDSHRTLGVFSRFTLRSLAAHPARTVACGVGVALACALLTCVALVMLSMRATYLHQLETTRGTWQLGIEELSPDAVEKVSDTAGDALDELVTFRDLGSAALPADAAEDLGTYVNLITLPVTDGTDEVNATVSALPALSSGRWPQKAGEIVLHASWEGATLEVGPSELTDTPATVTSDGTVQLGSQLSLALGRRIVRLSDYEPYSAGYDYSVVQELVDGEVQVAEKLSDVEGARTLTVVGFYEDTLNTSRAYVSPAEPDPASGSLLTARLTTTGITSWQEMSALRSTLEDATGSEYVQTQQELLSYQGLGDYDNGVDSSIALVMVIVGLVTLAVAMSLTATSFSVSIRERTRQFGLLSSLGASRRQLRRCVLAEATCIGAVAIPAGALLGIGAAAVALAALESFVAPMMGVDHLALTVDPLALAAVVAVTATALLVSALAPARRAGGLSALAAIQDTFGTGSKMSVRQTRRLILKPYHKYPFGVPGLLAKRSLGLNRGRRSAAVASLAIAFSLVAGAGSVAACIGDTRYEKNMRGAEDLTFRLMPSTEIALGGSWLDILPGLQALVDEVSELPGVAMATSYSSAIEPTRADELKAALTSEADGVWEEGNGLVSRIYLVDDATWERLCDEAGIDDAARADAPAIPSILVNWQQDTSLTGARPFTAAALGTTVELARADLSFQVTGLLESRPDWLPLSETDLCGVPPTLIAPANRVTIPVEEGEAAFTDIALNVTCSDSTAAGRAAVQSQVLALIDSNPDTRCNDYRDEKSYQERYVLMQQAYRVAIDLVGAACSVVAVAGAFNVITAGIGLRGREVAALRSVGLSWRGVRRMIALECGLIGVRALAWGLPVPLAVYALLYRSISGAERGLPFSPPWGFFLAAAALVALTLALSAAWSLSHLKREDLLDTLRHDT